MSRHFILLAVPITWESEHDISDLEAAAMVAHRFLCHGLPNVIVQRVTRLPDLDMSRVRPPIPRSYAFH